MIMASVSVGESITPISGRKTKKDTHDVVLTVPEKLKSSVFGATMGPSPTAYGGPRSSS